MSVDETSGQSHDSAIEAQVAALVAAIPAGQVMSYGEIGARCDPPISGYVCGRFIWRAPAGLPWWRVVAKDGSLPIAKRDPAMASLQRQHLVAEGHRFDRAGRLKKAN